MLIEGVTELKVLHCDRASAKAIWRVVDSIADGMPADSDVCVCRVHGYKASLQPGGHSSKIKIDELHVSKSTFPLVGRFVRNMQFCVGFRSLLKRERPDVLHLHFAVPGLLARVVARFTLGSQVKIVCTCHEIHDSLNPWLRFLGRLTERYVDAVVYVSKAVAESYPSNVDDHSGHKECVGNSVRVIHNGVDVELIEAIALSLRVEEDCAFGNDSYLSLLGSKGEDDTFSNYNSGQGKSLIRLMRNDRRGSDCGAATPRLVSVGRLVPEKGHATVIRALPRLIPRYPGVSYTILGEGPCRLALAKLAKDLGVESRVRMPGWTEFRDTIHVMCSADVILAPSRHEGFGLALAEAMLCRVPIVASKIPAFEEVAGGESEALRFVACEDAESISAAINSLLASPPPSAALDSMADRIREYFDVRIVGSSYLRLYQEIVNRS